MSHTIGAGASGVTLLGELRSNPDSRYTPYCMIDDASDKMDKHIHGVPVRGPIDNLEEILQDTPVTEGESIQITISLGEKPSSGGNTDTGNTDNTEG